ncbi:C40 family peptidase [Roseicitreum antarcticum]|uniref:NlpC/P60 family protein n=1 Tax=Roseicitreum antarcticum TaxID=564137 RepID=A0A1H2VNF2_9RHOB|nr:NlpC/P60 family protein [Roseicitreum antarcticum]SDW69831.1 NlpC/P60 family protein [Roseicitreum antarcticum]
MSDPRLTPANAHVVHDSLRDRFPELRAVSGVWARVLVPVADLCASPGGGRARQMLAGARFLTLDRQGNHVFGQAAYDGYVGWLGSDALCPDHGVTHRISALASHIYPSADMKTGPIGWLPHGAFVGAALNGGAGDAETSDVSASVDSSRQGGGHASARHFLALHGGGYVPAQHLAPLTAAAPDLVDEAMRFLGVPYLWGGNSPMGIDCSGLVQAAFRACGAACPGDSDLQRATLGTVLDTGGTPQRGDLIFWDGHVGFCAGPDQLLHANAHHMAVTLENLSAACERIAAAGVGPVRAIRRLPI